MKRFIEVLLVFNDNEGEIRRVFEELFEAYSSDERYYHNIGHLKAMLEFLETHEDQIKNFDAVYLATWYHDRVYDSKSKTNEQDSSEKMKSDLTALGLPKELIDKIGMLIMATQKHQNNGDDPDCRFFLDADLSILSSSEEVYMEYASNIRREYEWVPEAEYKIGRRSVLESFLKRDWIYFSDSMRDKELIARENIRRELSSL